MRSTKKYDKKYLEKIVKGSKSFREIGKKIGIDGKIAKSTILRYKINFSHFTHGKMYESMIGQKFNMLKVLSIYRIKVKSKRDKIIAKCLCDCGKEKDILASSIKAKRTGSCGCDKSRYEKTRGKNSSLYKGYGGISGKLWGTIKRRAEKRDYKIDISIKYVWELYQKQKGKCALSDVPIIFGIANHKNSCTTASLDRIDNTKGYIKNNVQWVHKSINIMKNVLPNNIFIGLCSQVDKNCGESGETDVEKLSVNHFTKCVYHSSRKVFCSGRV